MRTLALVGGTLLVCCIPFAAVAFIYGDDKMTIRFQRYAAFAGMFMPINAILNPIIYYFRSSEFRAFYKRFKFYWNNKRRVFPARDNTSMKKLHWKSNHAVKQERL